MNLTFQSIVRVVSGEWLFTWNSTGAAYYRVVLHGHEIGNTNTNSYTYNLPILVDSSEPPPIEVVEEKKLAVSELNLPYMILQWYGVVGAVSYRVYQQEGLSFVLRETFANVPQFMYTFITSLLSDEMEHKFRVVGVNVDGLESTPLTYTYKMVRPPLPVKTSYQYESSTGIASFSN
jgi:hypothetical protein